jgi:hypothetical protein
MNPLLSQLDDINGLAKVSWWPLAPGWWAVLALLALVIIVSAVLYLRRRARERSWKGDARRELFALEARLNDKNAQEVLAALSATLRRVAMQCFSRAECAGLEGRGWLQWLTGKDPRGFNWADKGMLLIEAPYLPPGKPLDLDTIKALLQATKEWVK